MTGRNIFENSSVPVNMIIDGEKVIIGQANLISGPEGIVHVEMDLKADSEDVFQLFDSGINAYSIEGKEVYAQSSKHVKLDADIQREKNLPRHLHRPVQHRDMKPPWCNTCRLDAEYNVPQTQGNSKPNFNFGKPASLLRSADEE